MNDFQDKAWELYTEFSENKDDILRKYGVDGYNKPKRTPNHPTKSHIVVAKQNGKVKVVRFGEQNAETAGKPKEGESQRMKDKRASFKARHGPNHEKHKNDKFSPIHWAWKIKW